MIREESWSMVDLEVAPNVSFHRRRERMDTTTLLIIIIVLLILGGGWYGRGRWY
jgi:hypothetical protein